MSRNETDAVRSARPKGKRCCQLDTICLLNLNLAADVMNNSCLTEKGRFITIWDLIHVQKEENDETNIPAQQKKKKEKPWLSGSHENKRRSAHN